MPHIIVLDDLSSDGLDLLKKADGITFLVKTGLKGDELRAALCEADGAICRSGVKITADSLRGNTRLKAIVRAGVGTDNIDKDAATRQGIIVMNTPAGNTVSTAEHTMAMILALSRNIAPAHESLKAGKWDRKSFSGTELRGKTIGIVGLGRIGQAVAVRCAAFEMKVIGYDPFLPRDRATDLGIPVTDDFAELLQKVDYLTVHTPLTPETTGLINTERLSLIKPGLRLINCARGGIYDEAAMIEGLNSGKIAGVALDVYANEPCTDSPLFQMPGVVATPHLGASTEEAQTQVATEAVELLTSFLKTGEIRHAVNTAPVDVATLRRLGGQLNLCFRLGMLMSQWHSGPISQCDLEFAGELAGEDTRLLSNAFCTGLLQNVLDGVNFINAEALCRERGIAINRESRDEHGTFSSLVSVITRGDGPEHSAAGTLFGKNMPRLVRLHKFQMETFLDGNLLIFRHKDVPGIVGFVGQLLATYQVNIAQMAVGRTASSPGGDAIGVLNLDGSAPDEAVARILAHDHISSVRQITLPPMGTGLPGF